MVSPPEFHIVSWQDANMWSTSNLIRRTGRLSTLLIRNPTINPIKVPIFPTGTERSWPLSLTQWENWKFGSLSLTECHQASSSTGEMLKMLDSRVFWGDEIPGFSQHLALSQESNAAEQMKTFRENYHIPDSQPFEE